MTIRRHYTTEAADAIVPLEELARVVLAVPVETDEGRLPAGASGTVVSVYDHGVAYCIEFTYPVATLAVVPHADLVAASGEHADPGPAAPDDVPGRA